MKKVELFYLEHCPHCKKARVLLDELQKEERYAQVEIEWIEETVQKERADQHDYYYVPCFYVDGLKVKEGAVSAQDVREVLEMAIDHVF